MKPISVISGIIVFLMLLMGPLAGAANAKDASWQAKPFKYIVIEQDLKAVLEEFSRIVNVPVRIGETVDDRHVTGPMRVGKDVQARAFLDHICDAYGLIWYFDGAVMHISGTNEIDTDFIKLGQAKPSEILEKLEELGLSDSRFSLRADDDVLSVSGPPAYRSIVRKTVLTINDAETIQPARETNIKDHVTVRVFRGGH